MRLGCPRCGSYYDGDEKFCARDGTRLVPAGLAPTPSGMTPVSSATVPPARPLPPPGIDGGATDPMIPAPDSNDLPADSGAPDDKQTPPAKQKKRRTTLGRTGTKRVTRGGAAAAATARKPRRTKGNPAASDTLETEPLARSVSQPAAAPVSSPPEKPRLARKSSVKPKPPTAAPPPPASSDGGRWLAYANIPGSMFDGRYLVSRKVADGGMSSVFLAQDQESGGELVAIKILAPELSEDLNAMERLRREADMGVRLVHRNVCSIKRMGETSDGLVYVVMPYIDGEILCDRTYRLGAIPLPVAIRIVHDIAAGLHAAHELEIIHRDLKPENVMLCAGSDGEEHAVVMDFGLAKDREAAPFVKKLTATGIVLGTPEFMSPEQLRGKPLDRRSDIYSLALLTYEMLTGKLPFAGENQQDLLLARLRSHPIPIRTMRPDLGFTAELEKVLIKGLHRVAEERYETAPQFAEALERASTSEGSGPSVLGRLFGGT